MTRRAVLADESGSVAVEAACVAPLEAVVSRLAVGVVGDHAVVSRLFGNVCDDDWSLVLHALATLLHRGFLLPLHSIHAPLRFVGDLHVSSLLHRGLRTRASGGLLGFGSLG